MNCDVIYGSDNNYIFPTLVSAASFAKAADKDKEIVFHLLDTGVTDEKWAEFCEKIRAINPKTNFERHIIDKDVFKGVGLYKGSIATYARILAAKMMPDVDWAIYIDGDTLCLGDCTKMLELKDDTKLFQMSIDPPGLGGGENPAISWYEKVGLKFDRSQWFCAGVMLMNLKALREFDFVKKSMEFLKRYPNPPLCDQMIMCYLGQGRISPLPKEWGIYSFYHTEVDIFAQPCIVHYATDVPWKRAKLPNLMSDIVLLWHKFVKENFEVDSLKDIPRAARLWRRGAYLFLKYNQWLLKLMGSKANYFRNTKGL